MTLNAEHLL